MNLCDSCKTFDGCDIREMMIEEAQTECGRHDPITRADLAAKDAEIAGKALLSVEDAEKIRREIDFVWPSPRVEALREALRIAIKGAKP